MIDFFTVIKFKEKMKGSDQVPFKVGSDSLYRSIDFGDELNLEI
jgi:hypothetical protein